jgi:hypothetical protein
MTRTVATLRTGTNALLFNGGANTDNINVLRSSTKPDMTQRTFALWLNVKSLGGGSGGRIILRGASYLAVSSAASNSYLLFQQATSGGQFNLTIPNFNTWVHLAVTYDRSGGSPLAAVPIFYINGVASAPTSVIAPTGTITADGANNIIIGNNAAAGGIRCFDGPMADIFVYSRILTPAEILSLYNGVPPSATSLVVKYRLTEGAGTTTQDESGNGFQGTILGATWSTAPVPLQRVAATTRSVATTRAVA